jgi:DNA-binding response OmpR family regulator
MKRILLVEDYAEIADLLAQALDLAGYAVETTATFAAGKAALTRQSYDLVISDVILPDGAGTEIVAEAREKGAKTLLITGHPHQMDLMDMRKTPYLAKPFKTEELVAMVARIFAAESPGDV